jgi:hypothetical protein
MLPNRDGHSELRMSVIDFEIKILAAKSPVRNGLLFFPLRHQPYAELDDRGAQIMRAIELLRETADEYESRAKQISDRAARAELIDICVEWHWLARGAATLYDRAKGHV